METVTEKGAAALQQAIGKTARREFFLTREANAPIDEAARTVELAFSSEAMAEQWFGYEFLSHDADAVDLTRMNSGAAVLLYHQRDRQVGVVVPGSARIDADRIGRCMVKFSRSQEGLDVFNDVLDGIRTKVSCGYRILQAEYVGEQNDEPIIRATKWEPYEVSFVSIPADNDVGVGRSANFVEEGQPGERTRQAEGSVLHVAKPAGEPAAAGADAQRSETVTNEQGVGKVTMDPNENTQTQAGTAENAELARAREIIALGELLGDVDAAREFAGTGKTLADYRASYAERRQAVQNATVISAVGMDKKDVKRYSLMGAVRAMINGDWAKAGMEREISNEIAKRVGREVTATSFFVPYEVQREAPPSSQAGNQSVTLATPPGPSGGYLVENELRPQDFVSLVRAGLVLRRLGARVLTGLVGDLTIPKQISGTAAYWVEEDEVAPASKAQFGILGLKFHTIAARTRVTRQMLLQSSIDVENLLKEDLASALSEGVDIAGLYGSGTDGQPRGLINITGPADIDPTGAGDPATTSWEDIVAFEGEIDDRNLLGGRLAYLSRASLRSRFKARLQNAAGAGGYITTVGNQTNGYEHLTSSIVRAQDLFFGDWSQVIIGEWGVLEVKKDVDSDDAGGHPIKAFYSVDIGFRRPESFAIQTDAL